VSSRRTLILLGAVGVGLVAALLLYSYVNGIEEDNRREQEPVAAFVAKNDIPQSADATQAFDAGDIEQGEIAQKYLPNDAIKNKDDIEGKVAIVNISPKTVITRGMFADPITAGVSFRSRLQDPTHVAVTIRVDEVRGVAGLLAPGDDVNILVRTKLVPGVVVTPEDIEAGEQPPPTEEDVCTIFLAYFCGEEHGPSVFLYQKVNILAVDTTAQLQPGEATPETEGTTTATQSFTGLVTFNVPADAAAVITSVPDEAIYLTLLAKEYTPSVEWPQKAGAIFAGDILPGEDPALITPYGPQGLEENED
jgi:pilus assembly protein CpaB